MERSKTAEHLTVDTLTLRHAILLSVCAKEAATASGASARAHFIGYRLNAREARITMERLAARGLLDKAQQKTMYTWQRVPPTYKTTPKAIPHLARWRQLAGDMAREFTVPQPKEKPTTKKTTKKAAARRPKKKHSTRRR